MRVEIYSDVVCPWCYIGERRFRRAVEAFHRAAELEVVFRPYQLDPSAPEPSVPLLDYLRARYGSSVEGMVERAGEAAAAEGIEANWEAARAANTLAAHRLLWLVERELGSAVQRALAEELFELHFARGGDVSDPEALVALAASVGVDPGRARGFLGSEEGLREVQSQILEARGLGVRAVPTFVFEGRYAIEGAQPPGTLLRALEEVAARAAPPASSGGDDNEDAAEAGTR